MTTYALYHSSELDLTDWDAGGPFQYTPGWYVCPSIPEGAVIDHRMRGPFATTSEAFTVSARMELTEP